MEKQTLIQLTDELYRLTILFPKKESLRYKIREQASEFLADFIALSREKEEQDNSSILSVFSRSLRTLEVLESFLEIARRQNWVSMNKVSEIQARYAEIRKAIEQTKQATETETVTKTRELTLPVKEIMPNSAETIPAMRVHSAVEKINDRQKIILETLKKNERAQVWNLKKVFPDISKRTLRRDFEQLYNQGLIERIGERNDTYYRLSG
ncbi:MAG: DeoR family transcriptional regulator [bacterium]